MMKLFIDVHLCYDNFQTNEILNLRFHVRQNSFEKDLGFEDLRNTAIKKLDKYCIEKGAIYLHSSNVSQNSRLFIVYLNYEALEEKWQVLCRMSKACFLQYIQEDICKLVKEMS